MIDSRRGRLEAVLHELEQLHRGGVRVTKRDLERAGYSELLGAVDRFGGLQRVRRPAGIPFFRPCRYSDDELVALVRQLAAERPNMTLTDLEQHRIGSRLRVRFGSLEEAARRAGVQDWPVARRGRASGSPR